MSEETYFNDLPWLARLPREDRSAFAQRARVRVFPAGSYIVTEGAPADALYVITDGRARVVVSSGTGEEATLAVMGPGEPIGEVAVFDGLPRSASVITAVDTKTLMVTRESVWEWVREHPEAAIAIIETLAARLRRTDQKFSDLSFLDLAHRLAKQLLNLAAVYDGEGSAQNRRVKLKITQGELASLLGVSRESVNKQVNVFAREGWVSLSRGAVTIENVRMLRDFV